jgi:uncharacterized protein YjbI with pentapeptide repeats
MAEEKDLSKRVKPDNMNNNLIYHYIDKKFDPIVECPVCAEPFIDPRELPCDDRDNMCLKCIQQLQQSSSFHLHCPTCQNSIQLPKDVNTLSISHKSIRQKLNSLKVYCTNRENGCFATPERSNLKDHIDKTCENVTCQYKMNGCEFKGTTRANVEHLVSCPYTTIQCCHEDCDWKGIQKDLDKHLKNSCKIAEYEKQQEIKKKIIEKEKKEKELELKLQEKRKKELNDKMLRINSSTKEWIKLNVGGQEFQTSLTTLKSSKDSVLYYLFSRPLNELVVDDQGRIILDFDGTSFGHILTFLQTKYIPRSPDLRERIFMLAYELEMNDLCSKLTNGLNLSGVDLSGRDLKSMNFSQANLSQANLTNAQLPRDLSNVNLSGVDLSGRDLKSTNLSQANLSQANLTNAQLPQDLSNVNLSGVDLSGHDLKSTNLSQANLTNAKLPRDLSNVNLSGVDLSGHDLSEAYLDNTNLTNATVSRNSRQRCQLYSRYGAILTGVKSK